MYLWGYSASISIPPANHGKPGCCGKIVAGWYSAVGRWVVLALGRGLRVGGEVVAGSWRVGGGLVAGSWRVGGWLVARWWRVGGEVVAGWWRGGGGLVFRREQVAVAKPRLQYPGRWIECVTNGLKPCMPNESSHS